jgi:vacuolar-type H+-ATPase subunit I/STV1
MIIAFLIIGVISVIIGIASMLSSYSIRNGLFSFLIGVFIILGSIFQYNYVLMHSDPANTYTSITSIGNGNNVILLMYQCIPLPFQPDKCETIQSVTIGEEDITSYITTVQRAYYK